MPHDLLLMPTGMLNHKSINQSIKFLNNKIFQIPFQTKLSETTINAVEDKFALFQIGLDYFGSFLIPTFYFFIYDFCIH